MSSDSKVSGRRKWWNSLPEEEKFKRMQAISRTKWLNMTPDKRKEHGQRLREARHRARENRKKLENS